MGLDNKNVKVLDITKARKHDKYNENSYYDVAVLTTDKITLSQVNPKKKLKNDM
jgi:hypothetical protein